MSHFSVSPMRQDEDESSSPDFAVCSFFGNGSPWGNENSFSIIGSETKNRLIWRWRFIFIFWSSDVIVELWMMALSYDTVPVLPWHMVIQSKTTKNNNICQMIRVMSWIEVLCCLMSVNWYCMTSPKVGYYYHYESVAWNLPMVKRREVINSTGTDNRNRIQLMLAVYSSVVVFIR